MTTGEDDESAPNGRIRSDGDRARHRHLVVCGDNPLALRLADELRGQPGVRLTAIVRAATGYHAHRIAQLPGVRVVEAAELDGEAFERAGLAGADVLALVDQDDVGNIHAALRAQEVRPDIRLVIRFFNMSLGYRVREMFPDSSVLSDTATAAPSFVAAALGQVAPSHARLPGRPGRTAYVARRGDVPPERVLCGLAGPAEEEGGDGRLPADETAADLVLALAEGAAPDHGTPSSLVPSVRSRVWRGARVLGESVRALASRKLALATLGLLGLLGLGTVAFAGLGYTWSDAVYFTVLDAAGAAQPDSHLRATEKIIQSLITVVGIAFIPVLTAAVVDAIVSSRLAVALGRPRAMSDHVVVVGLGNVGSRVVGQLHDLGVRVVGVEADERSRGVPVAQRLGIPVVIGDASREDTLRAAHVHTSRVLVAVTNNDITNLEAALHGRAMSTRLRIVLRLFDDDLADRMERQFGVAASRSVSFLAAPAFAAAVLQHRVLATIPVGRRVLLVAEVPVATGTALVGERAADSDTPRLVRVFALQRRGSDRLEFPPSDTHLLAGGDRLLVVATRGGLNRLLARADPSRLPEPDRPAVD